MSLIKELNQNTFWQVWTDTKERKIFLLLWRHLLNSWERLNNQNLIFILWLQGVMMMLFKRTKMFILNFRNCQKIYNVQIKSHFWNQSQMIKELFYSNLQTFCSTHLKMNISESCQLKPCTVAVSFLLVILEDQLNQFLTQKQDFCLMEIHLQNGLQKLKKFLQQNKS